MANANLKMLYLVFTFLNIINSESFSENPIKIADNPYPIVFNSNIQSYNIITSTRIFKLKKSTRGVDSFGIISYSPPFFVFKNKKNEYFLFAGNDYLILSINNNLEVTNLKTRTELTKGIDLKAKLSSKPDCIGYIAETKYTPSSTYKGMRCPISYDNEIIIYAKIGNTLYFFYIKSYSNYQLSINNIEDHISCRYVDSSKYACSFIQNNKVQIGVVLYKYQDNSKTNEELSLNSNNDITRFSNHDNVVLNDIEEKDEKKILCAKNKDNNLIECCFVEINIKHNLKGSTVTYSSSVSTSDLNGYYESLAFKMDNCYFTGFYNEYLFCCGGENFITCYRMDETFNLINKFEINLPGKNDYLTIINNNDYASIFYMNENPSDKSTYEYFLYPSSYDNNLQANTSIIEREAKTTSNINPTTYLSKIKETTIIYPTTYLEEIKETTIINPNTYFEEIKETEDEIIECHKACLNCNKGPEYDNTNCIKCDNEKGYYSIYGKDESNCLNNEIINTGYFLNTKIIPYTWDKCHEKCKTCFSKENSTNMNCLTCNSNQNFLYNGNCMQTCPNNTFKFYSNYSCLNSCPNGYVINYINNECIINTNKKLSSIEELKLQILGNLTNYVNNSNVFNGSNFLAMVLSSDDMDPEDQIKMGISAVDLGNCSNVLKQHYNIPNEENLIILNIETKNNESSKSEDKSFNLGKNLHLEIYDNSGNKLNLSICKEDIKVMKYIGDVADELNINSAKDYADKGVDVFNPQDDFFNDICHPYDNTDGKDIILDDRRSDLYQNTTFCENGCTYTGMNYDLMVANCLCDSDMLEKEEQNITNDEEMQKSESLNFKTISKSFIENLFDFNYKVIFCYNLVLDSKILVKNIGFYSLFVMFVLQMIFLFVYIAKKLKSIRNFMLIFKNKKLNINNITNDTRSNKSINKSINNSKNKIKLNNKSSPPKSNNTSFNFKDNTKMSLTNYKSKSTKKRKKLKSKNINDDKLSTKTKINSSKNLITDIESINLENQSENNYLKFPITSKSKKRMKEKNINSNNFLQAFDLQSSYFNTNKKGKKPKTPKKTNSIEFTEREEIFSTNQIKELNLENSYINNDKIYNRKLNRQKNHKRNILNKKGKKNVRFMETIADKKGDKKISIENKGDFNKLSHTSSDIQDMDYEEAIIYDKRSYLMMYWAYLVDTQIILGTFCTENYLNLLVIKLSFFICTFQISFFLNAFFYSDEYISDAYHNDGILDFVSGLPKSIYSFVATLITTNLLKMLSNSQSELKKVIREKGKNKNYVNIINIKLKKLRKKLIVYFILVFLLEVFFLYYVTAFCAVYRNSQKYWFYGCLESFAMDSLVALIICIILSLLRYISIKKQIKCFYTLANIIGTFL